MKNKPLKFAQEHGFDKAEFVGQWKGYTVFEAHLDIGEDGEPAKIGLPQYILEKDGSMRFSDYDETFEILDDFIEED